MSTPTPDDLRYAKLAAHADGHALNDAALDELQAIAGGEAALARRIDEQKHLQAACARAMNGPEHRCPDDLRTQITASTDNTAHTSRPAVAGQIKASTSLPRWIAPLAAAAVIALGTVTAVQFLRGSNTPQPNPASAIIQHIKQPLAQQFDSRHRFCANDPSQLFNHDQFPQTIDHLDTQLAQVVDASLGSATLDLSPLGYTYRGAGICNVPGPGAVHIVYGNDQGQSLSLWLRADDGTFALQTGQMYGPAAGSPQLGRLLIWRDGNVVLYLVGDLPQDVQDAQATLQIAAL